MIYAGIGSRETPLNIQQQIVDIGFQLGQSGWLLRSGHADGADQAFEEGAISVRGKMEIFLPWPGFNDAPKGGSYITRKLTPELLDYAKQFHPAWDKCSNAAKSMHARNVCQIMGEDGNQLVDLVICWTKNGKGGGGTGQALRIAKHHKIPIFDLALPDAPEKLCKYTAHIERMWGVVT